jgi:hypothetical protein
MEVRMQLPTIKRPSISFGINQWYELRYCVTVKLKIFSRIDMQQGLLKKVNPRYVLFSVKLEVQK